MWGNVFFYNRKMGFIKKSPEFDFLVGEVGEEVSSMLNFEKSKIILILRFFSKGFDASAIRSLMYSQIKWRQSCCFMSCMNYTCNIWIWWINSWTNYEPMNMNKGKTMNHEYEYAPKLWTREFQKRKICEPMNFIFFKSMNPWIWKLELLWTHEYEYQYFHEPVNMNMYTLLYELFKVHTGHEIPWTISWTPWILMCEKYTCNFFGEDFS